MIIFLIITTCVILAIVTVMLSASTTISASFQNSRIRISLAVVGCGIKFDSKPRRFGIFCGNWVHFFKTGRGTSKKKDKKRDLIKEDKSKPGRRRRLPLSTIVRIARAFILFVARFLSCVQYDIGKINVRPAIANPALAGMAYGWGQALNGAFPGVQRILNIAPNYGAGAGSVSGRLVLSIKNRQIVVLVWRLLRDLPIKEIIKNRFFRKR
jgi:hypothetical protein